MATQWVETGSKGYALALQEGKLKCRNKAGKELASVPSAVRKGEVGQRLLALQEWLSAHERECLEAVESWLLRSHSLPRDLIGSLWPDPAWRRQLENSVVAPADVKGCPDFEEAGLLRGVDPARGVGVVNLDGETLWLSAERVIVPHPVLLPEADSFRELVGDLGVEQGISQLFREVFTRQGDASATALSEFSGGKFEVLSQLSGRCRSLGYRVRGGFATLPLWEQGRLLEARFWIGDEDPEWEAYTGDLLWADDKGKGVSLGEVGAVAYSEGVRMASLIYAGRQIEGKEDE